MDGSRNWQGKAEERGWRPHPDLAGYWWRPPCATPYPLEFVMRTISVPVEWVA